MIEDQNILSAIEKFDLLTYCQEHYCEDAQGDELVLMCPSCGKDKLIVNIKKKTWHCWVCQHLEYVNTPRGPVKKAISGAGGLISLIQFLDGKTRSEAIAIILRQNFLDVESLSSIPEGELSISRQMLNDLQCIPELPELGIPYGSVAIEDYSPASVYLRSRGISTYDINFFRLFWCSDWKYANRVVFPVFEGGRFVYFQARTILEPKPGEKYIKSLNPPRVPYGAVSSDVLFNYDGATRYGSVCVTEGPVDAIHVGYDAVATFGKRISGVQIAKLVRAGVKTLHLMWDADARDSMQKVAPLLAAFFTVYLVELPYGDPGDFTRDQLIWYRVQSRPFTGNLLEI